MVALDQQKDPIGLMAYGLKNSDLLQVELLRVFSKHSLSSTIIRFIIGEIIKKASLAGCQVIRICDRFMDPATTEALIEDHFTLTELGWAKLSLPVQTNSANYKPMLEALSLQYPDLETYARNVQSSLDEAIENKNLFKLFEIEAALSPALITDSGIPCFIVPIQPQWAQHLFDEHLANHDFFGAKVDLALSREGVYYRSVLNSFGLSGPARIVWYVSHNNRFQGTGSLRAFSRLEEIVVGLPKPLFRQFRHLGIYDWKDVLKTAKGIDNQLMALRFSNTTMLRKPVPWQKVIEMLAEVGIKTKLQSPCRIPESIFFHMHSLSK